MVYLRVTALNGQWFLVPVSYDTTLEDVLQLIPDYMFLHPHELRTLYFFQPPWGSAGEPTLLPLETPWQSISCEESVLVKRVCVSVLLPDLHGFRALFQHEELKARFNLGEPREQSANYRMLIILEQVELMRSRRYFARDELSFQHLFQLLPGLLRFAGRLDAKSAGEFLERIHVGHVLSPSQLITVLDEARKEDPARLQEQLPLRLCRYRFFQSLVFECTWFDAECVDDELVPRSHNRSLETGHYVFEQYEPCVLSVGYQDLVVYDAHGEAERQRHVLAEVSQLIELQDCVCFQLARREVLCFYMGAATQGAVQRVQMWLETVAGTSDPHHFV